MHLPPPTIAPEVINCIAQGRPPRIDELHRVANHIRKDLEAFGAEPVGGRISGKLLILRAAQAALVGGS